MFIKVNFSKKKKNNILSPVTCLKYLDDEHYISLIVCTSALSEVADVVLK